MGGQTPARVPRMTKRDLLTALAEVGDADAHEIARALGVAYSVAAMGLLRLVRQGLVHRYADPDHGSYWYRLSDRGKERLEYLKDLD